MDFSRRGKLSMPRILQFQHWRGPSVVAKAGGQIRKLREMLAFTAENQSKLTGTGLKKNGSIFTLKLIKERPAEFGQISTHWCYDDVLKRGFFLTIHSEWSKCQPCSSYILVWSAVKYSSISTRAGKLAGHGYSKYGFFSKKSILSSIRRVASED